MEDLDKSEERLKFITVFQGPMTDILILQPILEGEGIFTHVANQNIKTIDPFVTGINAFDMDLQVLKKDKERAMEILLAARGERNGDDETQKTVKILRYISLIIIVVLLLALVYLVATTFS